jgi:hypothetical protein
MVRASADYLENGRLIFGTAVMNYTEMEAKVREATNNEPYDMSPLRLEACVRELTSGIAGAHPRH